MANLIAKFLHYEEYVLIIFFFVIEQFFTTSHQFFGRLTHLFHNVLFQVIIVITDVVVGAGYVYAINKINFFHIGLFYHVQTPLLLRIVIGVIFLDLVAYVFHLCTHNVSFLWRFHKVHHSDQIIDCSSNLRGHPVEVILAGLPRLIIIALLGLDAMPLLVFYNISVPISVMAHVNIKFPPWVDRGFGFIFVTPNFHKVHHDSDQTFTDSNYGSCFIIWDRIFKTFKFKPMGDIKYGLEEFDHREKQSVWYLLRSPFSKTAITKDI